MAAFIGAGIVSVAPWDNTDAFDTLEFRDVGNVSALTINITENRQELRNFRTAAGGTYASVARVETASLQMDFRDFSAENLELALWGDSETVTDVTTVEALVEAAPLVAVKFDGINVVDGKAYVGKFFKCRLGAPANLGLIGEDFGTLTIQATMEADTKITTTGKSQYFTLAVPVTPVAPPEGP
jgi:hypothetical protein